MIDKLINLLVVVTLVELMVAVGMSVTPAQLVDVARNWRLWAKAALANYVVVPAATVCLLRAFDCPPMVVAGFLVLAVCPGAPFGPPITAIAKGNVNAAIGLMVILAASSAVLAPPLLRLLLTMVSVDEPVNINAGQMIGTLLATQLMPLGIGLAARIWLPKLADRLQQPARVVSTILNLLTITVIVVSQFQMLVQIRMMGFVGMFVLLAISLAAGWLLGGPGRDNRKTVALTTSLRNAGVSLVIASTSFAGPLALTTISAYAIVEVFGCLLLAVFIRTVERDWRKNQSKRRLQQA